MEQWRVVEVAACEEMEGPSRRGARGDPHGELHRRGGRRARARHRPRRRRLRRRPLGLGRTGRTLDPLRPDLLGRARHGARAAAARRRARSSSPARASSSRRSRARPREHVEHAVRRAHPRRPRRADDLRHQARRLRVRGPPQRASASRRAFDAVAVGTLSGAVGTYSATSPEFEERVLARLALQREDVATQVVARDRHAALLGAIALAGAGLERLATEFRHLQRTEVLEAEEPFRAGEQKGSSSMPHKRNPITSERISGLARVLRGNASAALENVALWHERDISHSGVERVILPDSTILIDYMQHLAIGARPRASSSTPNACARTSSSPTARSSPSASCSRSSASGLERDEAYRIAQEHAQRAWATRTPLRELLAADPRTSGARSRRDLRLRAFTRYAEELVGRLDEIASRCAPALDARLRGVTALADLPLIASGKVRDNYDLGDGRLLMVASDRISTYDVVHPTPIPGKGQVLTGMSVFWFGLTREIVPNHLISATDGRPRGGARPRARRPAARDAPGRMRRARLPLGIGLERLPAHRHGLRDRAPRRACASPSSCPSRSSPRPRRPRSATTTRTSTSRARWRRSATAGSPSACATPRSPSTERAAEHARERGIIVADTKFEFGLAPDGTLVLGDEVLTPDSSRFWDADGYEPGRPQPSFDKQFVRDWATAERLGSLAARPGDPRRCRRGHARALPRRLRADRGRAVRRLARALRRARLSARRRARGYHPCSEGTRPRSPEGWDPRSPGGGRRARAAGARVRRRPRRARRPADRIGGRRPGAAARDVRAPAREPADRGLRGAPRRRRADEVRRHLVPREL